MNIISTNKQTNYQLVPPMASPNIRIEFKSSGPKDVGRCNLEHKYTYTNKMLCDIDKRGDRGDYLLHSRANNLSL